ncbi:MAG TPA: HD domain-containing phosphohydrolase [Polyangiaceae bacterium]|nr:HD domain-containing phosphohydrolase [Polyangiaceae bacterium]
MSVAGGAMDHVQELLERDTRLAADSVTRPHELLVTAWRTLVSPNGRAREQLCVVFAPAALWDRARELLQPFADRVAAGQALVVLVGRPRDRSFTEATSRGLATVLDADATQDDLYLAAHRAFELLEAKARAESRGRWLRRYRYELGELIHIARAMTTVRDVDKLLGVILEKSRFVTGADAGSIYVVEPHPEQPDKRVLRFKLTQNDSVALDSREFTMPLSDRSMAGTAALQKASLNIPDVYQLPTGSTFHFDPSFDRRTGYLTRSMLMAPLISQRDEVIGVIQLINKKRDSATKLLTRADVDAQVVPFDERSEELLGMVAAQAGVSLETAILYEDIRKLFEGFVKASVEAIESRDPTTSGHSRRVADLTVTLARMVDKESSGPYAAATFTAEDLRELEYASLLHDFGKIGVRERVLVKAKKLYDERLELVRVRFDYVLRSIEADVLGRKVRALESGASKEQLAALDAELAERRGAVDAAWAAVLSANEPTVLSQGDFARIEEIARETYVDLRGEVRALLDDEEVTCLKVSKGSLTQQEFDEIRSHVSHTFRFLSRIPWGKSLQRVPVIAGAHHERLNGTGYPNRLKAEEIPVQSKMMSIADIYDALTASDRPYKKAVPLDRAIDILDYSVKDGHLDAELVRIFKDARVWTQM